MVSTTKVDKQRRLALTLAVPVCLFASAIAHGADVEFGVRVGVSYSDNVFLDVSPGEIDDIVFRASPSITVIHESPTLDADLRYRFDWFKYDDIDATQSYHMGEGSITGKLFDEALQLEIGAIRMQTIRDQESSIPLDRLPLTGNLVDRDEVYANPRLETRLGRSVTLNAGYRYAEGSYDDPLIQDDDNHQATLSFDNYDAGSGLTWALRYDGRKTEYEVSRAWEYRIATAELGFWTGPNLRLFGSGGKESSWDDPFNPDLEDSFWEAGFAYRSGENMSAEFAAGERSFGTSWRGNLEYAFSRGTTSLSYAESPTTTGFNQSGGRRNVIDPDNLDEFLDVPGAAERYLAKRFDWDLRVNLRRTTFSLAVFDEDRSGRIQADGTPLADQAQRGGSVSLTWQAGARTEFVVAGSIVRRDAGSAGDSDYRMAGLGANYRLGQRTQLSLDYAYTEQQPDESGLSFADYKSNVISLFLEATF